MKKITWTWKKILTLICGFLGIGTLVSCYGMPINYEPTDRISGCVVGDIDGDSEEEPVPGIKVTATVHDYEDDSEKVFSATTDKDGLFNIDLEELYYPNEVMLKTEDVDGPANGSFEESLHWLYHGLNNTLYLNNKESDE